MEFEIRIHPSQRLAYIPKQIVQALGTELKAVPNRVAILLYPKGIDLKDVVKSIEIIKADIEHHVQIEMKSVQS